jgi:hypothetical protein
MPAKKAAPPVVRAFWDDQAKVWYGRSDEIPGLVVEAEGYDELTTAIFEAICDLGAAAGTKQRPTVIKIITEREQATPAAA